MKVSVEEFESAVLVFGGECVDTLPTAPQRFVAGMKLAEKEQEIRAWVKSKAKNGVIDTDTMKKIIESGMKHAGEDDKITFPVDFGVLAAIGVNPADVTLSNLDIDKFFSQTVPALCKEIAE